jgi:hypothetical protein
MDPLDRLERIEAHIISLRRILYVIVVLNFAIALILYWPA